MRATGIPTTVLLLLGLAAAATSAIAVQPTRLLWKASGVENVVAITPIDDLDSDGVSDVVFESYDAGPSGVDHLFAISGASSGVGSIIWSARPLGGPSNSGGYGEYCLQISPDLNGDGHRDLLYGSAWGGRSAYGLDALSGQQIWRFDTYADSPPNPPESGWIYANSSLESDITGDGVPEAVFCAGSYNYGLYCANGATGAVLWFFRGQDAHLNVFSIADVDGDGIRDVIGLQSESAPRVRCFSGRGGVGQSAVILWTQTLSNALWSGCELPQHGQPNTIVVGCWDNNIRGYNAATGALRWTGPVGDPVQKVVPIPDVDGDGVMDVAVGSWDNAGRVHSGANGALIWRSVVGTLNGGDCWTCDSVGDTNSDGIDDVAVGSFDTKAYLMDGRTGAVLWSYTVGDRVFSVRGVPDVTGNGIPEVAVGTQMLTNNPTGGDCWLFEGNDSIPPAGVEDPSRTLFALRVEPNPSREVASWSFALAHPAERAVLELFDPAGRRIRTLRDGPAGCAGTATVWDGLDDAGLPVSAGVYWGRLTVDGRVVGTARLVRIP
jgi:outer membrane protein assembly factor BamB